MDLSGSDQEALTTRFYSAYMLCLVNSRLGDHNRVIKFAETELKDIMEKHMDKKLKSQEIQNFILHLQQILADSFLIEGEYKKAAKVFYSICKCYNQWKVTKRKEVEARDPRPSPHEFGVDEYIRTKASYAECLMNLGQIQHAIDKFENAKRAIENEIVYENPMLFVNVCNQLGNCYLIGVQHANKAE